VASALGVHRRSRRRRRIITGLDLIDALLAQPGPKIENVAATRKGVQHLLVATIAEQLAERNALEACFKELQHHRRRLPLRHP
jgi:hypothetical protein